MFNAVGLVDTGEFKRWNAGFVCSVPTHTVRLDIAGVDGQFVSTKRNAVLFIKQ